jgi:2-oxoglutarate dehydrogenase E1 component
MNDWLDVGGLNQGAVLDLFERYRRDPASVDPETRRVFEHWTPPGDDTREVPGVSVVSVVTLSESIRRYGHLAASLDPLGGVRSDPVLELKTYGLAAGELAQLPAQLVGGPAAERSGNALEALEALRDVYCRSIGHDYAHVFVTDERRWLHDAAEQGWFRPPWTRRRG